LSSNGGLAEIISTSDLARALDARRRSAHPPRPADYVVSRADISPEWGTTSSRRRRVIATTPDRVSRAAGVVLEVVDRLLKVDVRFLFTDLTPDVGEFVLASLRQQGLGL
jgi:hypothetical protein